MIPATTYQKHLARIVEAQFADLSPGQLLDKLFEIGVVDFSRCKTLAVRQYVDELVRQGEKKTAAMWTAAEHFVCSYEYIRKCMYYYRDINVR